MDETDAALKKRFAELAGRAFAKGIYTYTDFLDMHSLHVLGTMTGSLDAPFALSGGAQGCERQMAMFGSEAVCGYEGVFPIACVAAVPLSARFADELTHRDFLGALMSLGVKREKLGDIVVRENGAYIFAHESIAPYIAENLIEVKHTSVRCTAGAKLSDNAGPKLVRARIQCASARADAVIARAYNLSREDAQTLFIKQKVFLNGAELMRPGETLKTGDVVSVRGFGRFAYAGEAGLTRKGRLNIDIDKYGA